MEGDGYLLGPGPEGRWDDLKVSCPVVVREGAGFRMFYYGHDRTFPGLGAETTGVPMGRSGTAVSDNGLDWQRQDGPGIRGAILDPSGDPDAFDAWQAGITDARRVGDEYWLHYMGAPNSSLTLLGMERKGYPVRIGAARGDGLRLTKIAGAAGHGATLANGGPGAWDEWYVSCPRLVPIEGGWRLYYHGRGPSVHGSVGIAEGPDGVVWEKRGRIFHANPEAGRFDSLGILSRHVVPYQGGWAMFYEAMSDAPVAPYTYSRIGLAFSADGLTWERQPGPGTLGCVLDCGPAGAWDCLAIGTPWAVDLGNGRWRLYYVGYDQRSVAAIGVAEAEAGDLTRWTKLPAGNDEVPTGRREKS
jgi:hypothetical protein